MSMRITRKRARLSSNDNDDDTQDGAEASVLLHISDGLTGLEILQSDIQIVQRNQTQTVSFRHLRRTKKN